MAHAAECRESGCRGSVGDRRGTAGADGRRAAGRGQGRGEVLRGVGEGECSICNHASAIKCSICPERD